MASVGEIKTGVGAGLQVVNEVIGAQRKSLEEHKAIQREAELIRRAAAAAKERLLALQKRQETLVETQGTNRERLARAVGQLATTLTGSGDPAATALAKLRGTVPKTDDHIALTQQLAVETGKLAGLVGAVETGAQTMAGVVGLGAQEIGDQVAAEQAAVADLEKYASGL